MNLSDIVSARLLLPVRKSIAARSDYEYNGFGLISTFRYRKAVTDPEQYVPLYTALPNARGSMINRVPPIETWLNKEFFPSVYELFETLPEWLICCLIDSFRNWTAMAGYSDLYAISSRISSVHRQQHYAGTYGRHSTLRQLRDPAGYSLENWAGAWIGVLMRMKPSETDFASRVRQFIPADIDTMKSYTLALPHHQRCLEQNTEVSNIAERAGVSAWTTTWRRPWSGLLVVAKFGYAGRLGTGQEDLTLQRIVPGMNQNPTSNNRYSDNYVISSPWSGLYGLESYFCLMIKAKYRGLFLVAAMMDKLGELELPKGAMELWEQENLKKSLDRDSYKTYMEAYYSLMRNVHKSPVRTFKNLTHQLFDLDTRVLDIEDMESEALLAKTKAKKALEILGSETLRNKYIDADTHF